MFIVMALKELIQIINPFDSDVLDLSLADVLYRFELGRKECWCYSCQISLVDSAL